MVSRKFDALNSRCWNRYAADNSDNRPWRISFMGCQLHSRKSQTATGDGFKMGQLFNKQIFVLGMVLAGAACGGDSTSPSAPPAGNYVATSFVTTAGTGAPANQLALGSTLQLNLTSNGASSGHLHTAAWNGSPAFDADMTGTWVMNGSVVDFAQAADTFVKDMLFTLVSDANGVVTLAGDQVFSGVRVQIVLTRTS
jgi:hypothetical protein